MAFGQDQLRVAHQGAEHRQSSAFHAGFDEPAMAVARHLVEDDPGDPHAGIVERAAQRYCSRRLRRARHVHHEHDRPAVARRDVGIRPGPVLGCPDAVEQAHGALGDHQIRRRRRLARERVEEGVAMAKLSRLKLGWPVAAW